MREVALAKLIQKKEKHSKMTNLNFTTLMMQGYLKEPEVTTRQAKTMFKFRTRMEKFSENFKGGKATKPCPVCEKSLDTQAHSFQCNVIKESIKVDGNLEDIFSLNNKYLAKVLENILNSRENYMEE